MLRKLHSVMSIYLNRLGNHLGPTLWAALILTFLSIAPLTEAQEVSGKPLSEADAKGFRMLANEFRVMAEELRRPTKGPTSDDIARLRIRSVLERAHEVLLKEKNSFMTSDRSPQQTESFQFMYETASRRLFSSSPNAQLSAVTADLITCSNVFSVVAANRSFSVSVEIKSYPPRASFTAFPAQGNAHPVEGITPQIIDLPLGAWRIRIKKEGFSTDDQEFDPFSGAQPTLISILRPSEDAVIRRDRRHAGPVDLTSTQSEIFKKASVNLKDRVDQAKALSHINDAEASLRGVLDKATADVIAVEMDFLQNANASPEQTDAARSFFDNIVQHHSEVRKKLAQKETVSYGRVS